MSFDEVLAHLRAYPQQPHFMIEERQRPHPELADFSADVLHTARISTALEGDVLMIGAALRIGTGVSAADNVSKGNLLASIDLATGRLGSAVYRRTGSLVRLDAHPVTGAKIEGRITPDWDRALAMLRTAAKAVPFNPLLGWDLAFTSEGPVLVEANDLWDLDIPQLAADQGLLATPLGPYLERRGLLRMIGLPRGPLTWSPGRWF